MVQINISCYNSYAFTPSIVNFIVQFTQVLQLWATKVPVELFVLLGSLLEEIIAPIPSPAVMTLAGSIAFSQGYEFVFLLWLALLGSVSKTAGTWVLYYFGVIAEDVLIKKWGKFFGLDPKKIEAYGKKFHKGNRDIWALIVLRAIPIMPTSPVSVICGIIKMPVKPYLIGTFFGNFIRGFFYLYLGFGGLGAFKRLIDRFNHAESFILAAFVLVVLAIILRSFIKNRLEKIDK